MGSNPTPGASPVRLIRHKAEARPTSEPLPESGTAGWKPFRLVFASSLALIMIVQFALPMIARLVLGAASSRSDLGSVLQLYTALEQFLIFLLTPVLVLVIFYTIGTKLDMQLPTHYLDLVKALFGGALLGAVLVYIISVMVSRGTFGPQTNLIAYPILVVLTLLQAAAGMTFLAFTGIAVGHLRMSSRTTPRLERVAQ